MSTNTLNFILKSYVQLVARTPKNVPRAEQPKRPFDSRLMSRTDTRPVTQSWITRAQLLDSVASVRNTCTYTPHRVQGIQPRPAWVFSLVKRCAGPPERMFDMYVTLPLCIISFVNRCLDRFWEPEVIRVCEPDWRMAVPVT